MRRLLYFLGKAAGSLRESPGVSALTAATIAATLLVAGLYAMGLENLEQLALVWGRASTLTAYIDDSVSHDDWQVVRATLEKLPGVERAVLVTPSQALARFRARGPAAAELVAGVSEEVLPAYVELRVRGGFADLEALERLAQQARALDDIDDVDYGQQEIERLRALLELLRWGGMAAGLLLLAAIAFIVSNTIRLTVYSRRDEIVILRLVGAGSWFVRTPFLFEGAIWGVAGGGGAAAALWLADLVIAPRATAAISSVVGGLTLHLFDWPVGVSLVVAGIALGVLGSSLAVSRFLVEETV